MKKKGFFSEALQIVERVRAEYGQSVTTKPTLNEAVTSGHVQLANCSFELFELNFTNILAYFAAIIIEKLHQVNKQNRPTTTIIKLILFIGLFC